MRRRNFAILLKVRHPDIDPAVLTDTFGLTPEYSWRAGEAKGEGAADARRRESYWVAQVPAQLPSDEDQSSEVATLGSIPDFLDVLSLEGALMLAALQFERRKAFWTRLQDEGATAQLIVLLGPSGLTGFELTRDVLAMLAKVGLSVSIDFRDAEEAAA